MNELPSQWIRFHQTPGFAGWEWSVWQGHPGAYPAVLEAGLVSWEDMARGYVDDVLDGLSERFPDLEFGGFIHTYVEYP